VTSAGGRDADGRRAAPAPRRTSNVIRLDVRRGGQAARATTVEFVGVTGGGKTTLARAIAADGLGGRPARMWTDLVTDRPGLRRIEGAHVINLLADAIALPTLPRLSRRDREFLRFAVERLRRHAPSLPSRLNYIRNVIRKVGIHHNALRAEPGTTFLFDEGTILSAYQLFVYSRHPFTQGELDRFAELVPMPDRVVHVKAPIDVVVERAASRSDPRRELRRGRPGEVRGAIRRAAELFDALVELDPIRSRTLTVELADGTADTLRAVARDVGGWIEASTSPSRTTRSSPPSGRTTPRAWRS
jgi:hypothetical protein